MDIEPDCGYKLTRHLIDLGHKKIAIVVNRDNDLKLIGYKKALKEAGLQNDLVFYCDYVFGNVAQIRKDIMSLRERPTAVFAYNDDLAAELIVELVEAGYSVPGDVSVVGVNDGWYSAKLRVPLTTYRLPQVKIGEKLVEMIVDKIEDPSLHPEGFLFSGKIVVRESTSPSSV